MRFNVRLGQRDIPTEASRLATVPHCSRPPRPNLACEEHKKILLFLRAPSLLLYTFDFSLPQPLPKSFHLLPPSTTTIYHCHLLTPSTTVIPTTTPSTTAISYRHLPPLSTAVIYHHLLPPPSTTAHLLTPSPTAIYYRHLLPPSPTIHRTHIETPPFTTAIHHRHPLPLFTTVILTTTIYHYHLLLPSTAIY